MGLLDNFHHLYWHDLFFQKEHLVHLADDHSVRLIPNWNWDYSSNVILAAFYWHKVVSRNLGLPTPAN